MQTNHIDFLHFWQICSVINFLTYYNFWKHNYDYSDDDLLPW